MTPEQLGQIILGLIGGGVGVKALDILWDHIKGRAQNRRSEVDRLARKLKQIETEKEHDDSYRRRLEEHLSRLNRVIIDAPCLGPDKVPAWPSRTTT